MCCHYTDGLLDTINVWIVVKKKDSNKFSPHASSESPSRLGKFVASPDNPDIDKKNYIFINLNYYMIRIN